MPPILNAQGLSKSFGATPLFRDIAFTVSDGDRIGLIGPNGAGKSTLIKILAGEEDADSGDVAIRKRARIGYVRQESTFAIGVTVREVLEAALKAGHVPEAEREGKLRETSGRIGLTDLNVEAAKLSGGWRKRLAIAEAIVAAPDVLLLDEPTNHLDLAGIAWLEGMLSAGDFASVIITHDRYFLENVATEIVELNRVYADGLLRVQGSYSKFIEARQSYLESQSRFEESLRNRVRTEIEWLRRGPKARATKAKARIDNANQLIGQLKEVSSRSQTATASIDFAATERQTKRLIELNDISIALGGRAIVENLNFLIANGIRVGLVGPNGSGKTTILRLLTGELAPSKGTINKAGSLRIVYFSQTRELPEGVTLRRALAPDSDSVVYQDRVIHVASYAQKFLFTGDQLNQPVERLSGGERARVLIARLMLEPADLLLLDEPTNDLDITTLEVLEESLLEYKGALVLVTHDRYMLDRVSTTVLGLDGKGSSAIFADYGQWEQWFLEHGSAQGSSQDADQPVRDDPSKPVQSTSSSTFPAKKKLSYLEAREFADIEERVEASDASLEAAKERVSDPEVAIDAAKLTEALAALEAAQAESDKLYARWAELTEKAG
jgi:ATP-binding cassette subfamily F protein uup